MELRSRDPNEHNPSSLYRTQTGQTPYYPPPSNVLMIGSGLNQSDNGCAIGSGMPKLPEMTTIVANSY